MKFKLGCMSERKLSGRKVAILGSGPAGLVAAGFLGCSGAYVDIYDKLPEPGGLLLFAIPSSRIAVEGVRGGVRELFENSNINFVGRTKVVSSKREIDEGDEFVKSVEGFDGIVDKYHAVLISTGAWKSRPLGIPGEEYRNVFKALDFLFRVKSQELGYLGHEEITSVKGKTVAVVGAGLSAIDAASESLKMGASKVYMLYRRTIKEAPAGEREISSLIRMGVIWIDLAVPVRIIGSGGLVKGVRLVKCRLGEPDESGRPKPIPIEGSDFELDVDIVINCVGEIPTPPIVNGELGIRLSKDGKILVNEARETTRKGVYAAGDVVLGPSRIGLAIKDGLIAARSMGNYLSML
ncbi:MAG: FAD-dependent oxidoreductase [Sulfolobales archaeon]|nr:FAD-dependent oxidoreductase [Sulfolobales archaeon]MDW7969422.1 FAD-dependent oxidoreductase [Sulfolobales archaeon]